MVTAIERVLVLIKMDEFSSRYDVAGDISTDNTIVNVCSLRTYIYFPIVLMEVASVAKSSGNNRCYKELYAFPFIFIAVIVIERYTYESNSNIFVMNVILYGII